MADVIPFKPRVVPVDDEQEVPHMTGTAVCLDCKHEWVAVSPLDTKWLECPSCTLVRGRYKYFTERGSAHWNCPCGNDLFHVTPEYVYCPNCGQDQVFP